MVDRTQRDSDNISKPEAMLAPMVPENSETTSRRRGRRKPRKTWKRPIRLSRLPSFGLFGFDFTFDQIPAIFSGYTASSEDSSSSEMSDASRSYSQYVSSSDENEEINQVKSSAAKRRASLKRIQSISRIPSMRLRRQLTRKLSGRTEARQRLKKVRSIKRSRSLLRRNLDSRDDRSSRVLSVEAAGLLQPHYLKPTSSSASKKVVQIQKSLKPSSGSMSKRLSGGLTRTSSLRPSRMLTRMVSMRSSRKKSLGINPSQDSSLFGATCSSALKDSKFGNDVSDNKVCTYLYCSLHGHHRHGNDAVPPLKRFVSMRRRLLKSQRSMKRGSVFLKRSLSRKRGSRTGQVVAGRDTTDQESGQVDVTADGESNQEICEERIPCSEDRIYGNDSGSNRRSPDIHDLTMVDVSENRDESGGSASGTNATTPALSTRKRWGDLQTPREESEPIFMDESNFRTETDTQKNVRLWRLIYQHMVTGVSRDTGTPGATKSEETVEHTEKVYKQSPGSSQDVSCVPSDKDGSQDGQKTEHDRSNAVKLVKQAFEEILAEIPDYSSDDRSITGNKTLDHEHVKGEYGRGLEASISASCDSDARITAQDTDVSGIASTSNMGEESNRRAPKNWGYLKKVIILRRFVKSLENVRNLNQREPCVSAEPDQEVAESMRLRHQLVGERKTSEEWMLDHALRQVISTLAPSQKKKVELLVQAFETVIPTDNIRTHLENSGKPEGSRGDIHSGCCSSHLQNSSEAEKGRMCVETSLREHKKEATDLQEVTEHPMQEHEQPDVLRCNDNLGLDTVNGKDHIEVASEVPAVSRGLTLDEPVESLADGSFCDSLAARKELDGSGSSNEEEKNKKFETGTKAEKQNLIRWRNIIYKHMVTGLMAKDESKHGESMQEYVEDTSQLGSTDGPRYSECFPGTNQTSMEEDGGAANSLGHAVKLVQEAFEKILSEIPDRSSDEETVSASSNSGTDIMVGEKEDLQHQDATKGWNNLKKVILLKRFVKSLEKVHNLNPRKPWCLPVKSDMEADKVHLRHRTTGHKKDAGELMLEYALRQVISMLAPSQRRKVALLVQAFDTVLDGGGQVLPLPEDETFPASATALSWHENCKQLKTDYIAQKNGATGKECFLSHLLEGTLGSKINLKPSRKNDCELKRNRKKDCEFNIEEQRIPAKFPVVQVNRRDSKEEGGNSVISDSSCMPICISDVKQRIMMENEKDTKLWKLIYQHMVKGPKRQNLEGEPVASLEDKSHDEGGRKIETRASGTVKLVREALEKILSEIPDHSSDDQSIGSDITTDPEPFERHCEVREAVVATEVHSDDSARDVACKQKLEPESGHESNKKSLKGWSNLKKVILLRRFVGELRTLTKLSPRNPQHIPLEPDPEEEKICLRHQPLEGRKSSEEWMLDYALRQVISTLEPSQKRKVAVLAQAFDTISLQEIGGCWSPGAASSPQMSRRSSMSSLIQSEGETRSEIGEARGLVKARDSGSPEASLQIAHPTKELAKCESRYNKQGVHILSFQDRHRDMNGDENHVVPCDETGDSGYCLRDDGETSTDKSGTPQEYSEETKLSGITIVACDSNLERQQCMSLWRLLCKQMELGGTDKESNQPSLEETRKEEENNDGTDLENQNADDQKMELYQTEAVKLLEEAIDEISFPESQHGDSRDDQFDNGNMIPEQKLQEGTNTGKDNTDREHSKTRHETDTGQMPQIRKGWSNLKRVILLKRFVKALEKMRKFNPREPRFLPLKPDPEAEKINLRHQETQNKKNGEEWMLDHALQGVVAKLTPARKRKVQLLVQAFETVIPGTGN